MGHQSLSPFRNCLLYAINDIDCFLRTTVPIFITQSEMSFNKKANHPEFMMNSCGSLGSVFASYGKLSWLGRCDSNNH